MALHYDPAFFRVAEQMLAAIASRPAVADHDIQTRRRGLDALFGGIAATMPTPSDMQHTEFETTSFDSTELTIHRFARKEAPSSPASAAVHFRGGGYIAGRVESFRPNCEVKARQSGVQIFSVEYRLAPEHPYPVPVEDCYAGLKWVSEHAFELGVDPTRIAVMGESAGGGLAAGVALLARDRHLSPPLAKQILTCPMLDAKNIRPVAPELEKHLFWTVGSNLTGWTAYLGDKLNTDTIPSYASATFADSVKGLPPTYIDVGDIDLFRDESIEYVQRLARENIPVEFHLYPGLPHAFGALGAGSAPANQALANQVRVLTTF